MIGKLVIGLVLAGLLYMWWRRATVSAQPMHPAEARKLLGVGAEASAEDIRAAHRTLIAKVHPDAGGSAGLATQVNAARDSLIEELKRR